ncbi:uncharacterized protein [Spinacia oleracea]|uniref:Retrotransposon gag domain-containing protein n=1 Tax=Spinacia oleracea TaxID=3562 RepID=A0ABM3RIW0_SPIOL|nr:uncharacterized protein LOC130469997 [Spinacia oleracea]
MGERTLKEMAAPNTGDDPLCIVFPELDKPLKLNSGFLNLLPKYYGKSGENPHRHLKEFKVVCSSMNVEGVEQDHIRLHAFPFSLQDLAKDWLYDLPAGSITTWNGMASTFLGKYFPASLIGSIRKEICGIRQHDNESLYEYWERFKRLCSSCPQHQISDQLLIQYFYEGLLPTDRGMIDASSGGALVDKTPTQARALISNMAQNTQQHGTRNDVKRVNGVDLSGIQNQLQENAQQIATLTTLVSKIVASNDSKARVCGIRYNESHPTDKCPDLQSEDVNAIGGYSGQRKYDPYSQTYNEGWKDHPNLRVLIEYQKKTDTRLHHIDTQIGQICTSLSNLETQLSGKLPSQTIPNPNGHVKAITLRSGKVLTEPKMRSREVEKVIEVNPEVRSGERVESEGTVKDNEKENEGKSKTESDSVVSRFKELPPFPSRFSKAKKDSLDNEMLETFRKIEVNIPLLDAIKQVPRYAKFLKELCTNKRQFRPSEKVSMGENISAIIQKKLPPKCKDHGMFCIPCKIGDSKFERCMLDLGASINVMPKSIYDTLNVGSLSKTDIVIQLADRSNAFPIGVLEDVLVQVNELVFPADFYVLDMGDRCDSVPLLLCRPFLKTSKTKIDVHEGNLTMKFDGEIIKFNIFDAMRYPSDINNVSSIDTFDAFDWMAQDVFDKE